MAVGTPVTGEAGEHQPERIKQFGSSSEGASDPGDGGALMQCEGGGNMQHIVDGSLRRLSHASSRVGGKRLKIAAGSFGVKDAESEGGFAGTGDAGDADDFVERNVHIDIFQIVNPRAANFHVIDHLWNIPSEKRHKIRLEVFEIMKRINFLFLAT